MKIKLSLLMFSLSFVAPLISGQQVVQVSSANRTISVTATETLRVAPELAIVHVGTQTYGTTQDEAFVENTKATDRLFAVLLEAKIPKDDIESESLELRAVESYNYTWSEQEKKDRKFQATQTWSIRAQVPDAQHVVDLAVSAGVNKVDGVDWRVADPHELAQKAADAALAQAQGIAQKMAAKLGAKVGSVLLISNGNPNELSDYRNPGFLAPLAMAKTQKRAISMLQLLPQKVESSATVYVVFAME